MSEAEMKECCRDLENRSEPERVDGRDDLTFTRCVCGRRHFELTVDPVEVGVHVAPLTGAQ